MDRNDFDDLARSLSGLPSRRAVVRGLVGAGLTLGAARLPETAAARKTRQRSVRLNAFGCVDVGGFCKTDEQCCSGICRGKKGRKRCRAHDAGGCRPGVQDESCGTDANPGTNVPCTTATGNPDGLCGTTTGNAGYCLYTGECHACSTDAECQEFCGPAAACIRCDGCTNTGGTSCAMPENTICTFPPTAR